MSVIKVNTIQNANGTTGITFAANGQMTLANTPLQLTGGQIKFPSTKLASADANTLDDYEEGTWTPTAIGQTSAGTTTYVGRFGTYTKIGNQVTATGYIEVSAMTGTGDLRLSLPFTVNVNYNYVGTVVTYNLDWPSAGSIAFFAPANQTTGRFLISVDNGTYSPVQTENGSWEVNYSVTYQV
jgi:hypothetical protein